MILFSKPSQPWQSDDGYFTAKPTITAGQSLLPSDWKKY